MPFDVQIEFDAPTIAFNDIVFGQQAKTLASSAVQNVISNIRSGTKTGLIYKRRTVRHQASAAGESPASDTGYLMRSIESNISGDQIRVYAQAEYAGWLEFGTEHMEPRPFLVGGISDALEAFNIPNTIVSAR